MRLNDAYPSIPALVFRGQTRYRTVWRHMRARIEKWARSVVEQQGVIASVLGAGGLEYQDLGLNTWGTSSMPQNHILLADLCVFCEVSGLSFAELLPPSERNLHTHERGQLIDLLRRSRSELLEKCPGSELIPEISAAIDRVEVQASNPLPPREAPTPLLSEARLPPWMRQRI